MTPMLRILVLRSASRRGLFFAGLACLAVFTLYCLAGCGSAEKSIRKAEAALALGEYAEAAGQFKQAYQRTPSAEKEKRGALAYRMAEAYIRYGNTSAALGAYRSAARYKYTDTLTYLHTGDAAMRMGDYKAAAAAYRAYLETHSGDTAALSGLAAAEAAPAAKKKGSLYKVKLEKLFNASRADYCPALLPPDYTSVYFSTTRPAVQGDELSGITAQKPGDIFFSKKDEKGQWKAPETAGALNTTFDEGAASFSPDGKTMYLTVCRTDPSFPRMAEIWTSSRSDAAWGKPQQLKITADTLSSYAHPAVSPDGRYLYFASDMPGGFGGFDIWRAPLDSRGLGAVENLGPDINTAADELFPAFRPQGELYFSSDRRGGFGGLDLYRAAEDTLTARWEVTHLPWPMNSNGDDFGITFEGLHNRGYFSSSRTTGGRGWDKIFSFSYPEVLQSVKGWVYEAEGYELPAAEVYMVGTDGTNKKLSVLPDGSFEQEVEAGVDYLFLAVCKGFLNVSASLCVAPADEGVQHVLQFPLPSLSIPVLVRGVYYEFDKAELTPNSTEALDRLATLLKENPNVTIELAAHTDYRGAEAYNRLLSQRRAESVVNYLCAAGIESERLTAVGYGESQPKVVSRKEAETFPFLTEGDTLTEARIQAFTPEEQDICNGLNRRTEFRVLRTTYGLFDADGRLRPETVRPRKPALPEAGEDVYVED